MFRKIFEFFHNTKPAEREEFQKPADFPLQLVKSSPFRHCQDPLTNSSEESILIPKGSHVNIDIETLEKTEIFSASEMFTVKRKVFEKDDSKSDQKSRIVLSHSKSKETV